MRLNFEAQRAAVIAGRRFCKGQQIHVDIDADDIAKWFEREYVGQGGPWGWGGFRSRDICGVANEIIDDAGDRVFHDWSRKGNYYIVFHTDDEYCAGPFDSEAQARFFGEVNLDSSEGDEPGQFIVVPVSRMMPRILKHAEHPSDAR